MEHKPLDIIFEDEEFIAINKPCAIMVHPTKITEDKVFLMQMLRDQIGQRVYTVHRLDRPTSGVLLFGKSSEAASKVSTLFRDQKVKKEYRAVVRGFLDEKGMINYPIANKKFAEPQRAVTLFKNLSEVSYPAAIGPYPSSRYTYLALFPQTGRRHQIRRHLSHLRHPIIGDKRYGDIKHNKYFHEQLACPNLLLHALTMEFEIDKGKKIFLKAPLQKHFTNTLHELGLNIL
jgi:tRNA pseudouridine65 synthase